MSVAFSSEILPPGHFVIGEDGAPDPTQRVRWVEEVPEDPEHNGGNWEPIDEATPEEVEAALDQERKRLVFLEANVKGESGVAS